MLIEFIKPDFEHIDERGSLIQLVHNGYKQVNYITSSTKCVRGNHYHKKNEEAFFIISGKIKLTLEKLDQPIIEVHELGANNFFIIKRNINHIFEFLEPTTLISMYSSGVEESDGSIDIFKL